MKLCIAFFLGFLQHIIKGKSFLIHLGEHIVGGTVQDTCNLFDHITAEGRIKRTNQGNTATDAGFKKEITVILPGNGDQFCPMLCNQLLVGSRHTSALLQGCLNKSIGRANASHTLHNNLDVFVFFDYLIIMNHQLIIGVIREISQVQYPLYDDFLSGVSGNALYICLQYFHHTGTDRAVS